MSTPLPGQIRCPTCHRSTPPAAFCTQCGTAIPESARVRPRGLDRDELQDRIRTHRPGDAAFRRGSQAGGASAQDPSAYRPYQPEPEDELILPGAADEGAPAHIDYAPPDLVEAPAPPPVEPPRVEPVSSDEETSEPPRAFVAPPVPVVADEPLRREPQPAPWRPAPPAEIAEVEDPRPQWTPADEPFVEAEVDEPAYRYRDAGEWDRRGPGMSPLAIGGFVLLGVLAIGVGALMAGLFSGEVAQGSPSPTPLVSTVPSATIAPSIEPTANPSAPASVNPTATPVLPPDDFTARTEPCAEQPAADGCGSSGSSVSDGTVWVWIGWRKGSDADTLGVTIADSTGATVGTGSLALSNIGSNGCGPSCSGYGRFRFVGLEPGDYTISVDRNGTQVAASSFTVNG